MSFVHLGGEDGSRPTYFEVLAADRLVPSLRAAVVYVMSALSQRHPWLHRVLQYEDEALAALMLLVDWHSLSTCDAAFAESLYGMRRKPLSSTTSPAHGVASSSSKGSGSASTSGSGSGSSGRDSGSSSNADGMVGPGPGSVGGVAGGMGSGIDRISRRQRYLGLLIQVGIPYLEAKLERLYKLHLGRGVLGLALRSGEAGQAAPTTTASRVRLFLLRAFVRAYPWLHAGCQAVHFGYHAAYLLGPSPVHCPQLQLQGVCMARVSAQDMELMAKQRAASRQRQLQRWSPRPPKPGGPSSLPALPQLPYPAAWALGAAARGMLRLGYAVSDHHRNALILAVFGFKALEWWYTAGEDRLAVTKALPPPPPPPAPRASPAGVGLPQDPSLCPVCRQPCTNPAQVATSGFVFCYPCAFAYVTDHGCCPVTLIPASVDHVRKLYEGS